MTDSRSNREIGKLAVWTVTSAKPGNGVELLRDGREDTYWQSDGSQPHLVNIQFQKKVRLQELAINLDYKLDESYTPNKISVRAGTSVHDLKEIRVVELNEPIGWVKVPLQPPYSSDNLKAYCMQLAILSNHQNGRDTHVRQIKVFGPRHDVLQPLGQEIGFTTVELSQFATIR
ncbi:anaphase-promoting complex, subunit 10 [Coccomyxa subellipsoidea C-169]|uniref:Anaphase-promoting complex subunit 10 n=1 Tax=Coccomyxa subellipsoidea (strain C-169) TaxID=574566 RepID=I0Z7N6_COCSC|nr:anaphase-promoting complex, subunit 10 [Coccomyxa subellipsoidea C-169]EIE26655.1 anaphase-promoting complex, subunit 10 [Coccomyxa subellipsoidea C-169]|eukprot:XP_005651199.1 anaphase-promoting complex, subunit 10 [Coccomyxa subellipsoidea C-169]